MEKHDRERIFNSSRNMTFAAICQILTGLVGLVERSYFLENLSNDYLGLTGLFSSILSFLSLSELGLGTVFAYCLYAPLAEHNERLVNSLLHYFTKAYRIIGIVIFVLGCCLLPFLGYILKTDIPLDQVRIFYVIYLIGVAGGYCFYSNTILIETDQKLYINTLVGGIVQLIQYILQILVLKFTQNFSYYLILYAIGNILKYALMYVLSYWIFPFIRKNRKNTVPLDKQVVRTIYKNMKATLLSKIGDVINWGSDSILISMLISTAALGVYANYTLIFAGVGSGTAIIFTSITASIGNLCALESPKKSYIWFRHISGYYFLVIGLIYCVLGACFNPLLHALYPNIADTFPIWTVVLLVFTRYLMDLRRIIMIYEQAFGIFRQDRYKSIAAAAINISFSVFFVKVLNLGIAGIFLGTICSIVLVYVWLEPLILHRYGFLTSIWGYGIQYAKSLISTIASIVISIYLINFLNLTMRLAVFVDAILTIGVYLVLSLIFMHKPTITSLKLLSKFISKKRNSRHYE